MTALILMALIGIVCMLSFKLFMPQKDMESGKSPVFIYFLISVIIILFILFLIWMAFMIFDVGQSMQTF